MAIPRQRILDILSKSGCLDFLKARANRAVAELERLRPDAAALLTESSRGALKESYRERFALLYYQALAEDVRERMNRFDPVHSMVISRRSIEPAMKAAASLAADGGIEEGLHRRFALLSEYEERVHKNYINSYLDFFDALAANRDAISSRLFSGKAFSQIQGLSLGGADLHRHGRSVMGVWTDAGVFYYKPHDCGLDALYHELVENWFSDCTVAADVVEGRGCAFVTCLRQESLEREEQKADYFRNFGILTALFHGLGSCDMHHENVMACGVRPSAIDIETLVIPVRRDPNRGVIWEQGVLDSVMRIGVLPRRQYRMPLLSPLYTMSESVVSLPEYDGRRYTVEGCENAFRAGFAEGYQRLLQVRGKMKELFAARQEATVRCLFQNTSFYDQIRHTLFRPEYLTDHKTREQVFHRLYVPYEQAGVAVNRALIDHERACLLQADIPYYCAKFDGADLCGEETDQIVVPDFFQKSALRAVLSRLDALDEADLRYEDGVIRDAFVQAPLDEPRKQEPEPLGEKSISRENARELATSFLDTLEKTVLRDAGGHILWSSATAQLWGVQTCGPVSVSADVGAYCAAILSSPALKEHHSAAMTLASRCAAQLRELFERWEAVLGARQAGELPTGWYGGMGGLLFACDTMASVGVLEADEAAGRLVRLIGTRDVMASRSLTVQEGTAGLLLALCERGQDDPYRGALIRACAERLLTWEEKAMPPRDVAGIGAALAAAFGVLGEASYARGAITALSHVKDAYDPALGGWPDAGESLKWLAGRGPHAALIALFAGMAEKKLRLFQGAETAEALRELALESLSGETTLFHSDTLNEGNALTVLCLTRLCKPKEAGRILEAMRRRAKRQGCYQVTPPHVRSFFDPALCLGTLGVGYAATIWLDQKENNL